MSAVRCPLAKVGCQAAEPAKALFAQWVIFFYKFESNSFVCLCVCFNGHQNAATAHYVGLHSMYAVKCPLAKVGCQAAEPAKALFAQWVKSTHL